MRHHLGLPLGTSSVASWLRVVDSEPRLPDSVLLWRQWHAAPTLGTEAGVGFGSAANGGFGEVPHVHASCFFMASVVAGNYLAAIGPGRPARQ